MYLSRRGIGMQWRMIRNNDLLDLYLYNLNSSLDEVKKTNKNFLSINESLEESLKQIKEEYKKINEKESEVNFISLKKIGIHWRKCQKDLC